jgi:DNA/RNA-binding domain of Phe-tRNA-synthetase-like protein
MTSALFVLDLLDPLTDDDAHAAADALTEGLRVLGPGAVVHRRLLAARPDRASP